MLLDSAIDSFLSHRRAANCAKGTLRLYGRQLGVWRGWLRDHDRPHVIADLCIDDLRDFASAVRDGSARPTAQDATPRTKPRTLRENTLASYHRTLRAFWAYLATEDQIGVDQARFFARIASPSVPDDPRPSTDLDTVRALLDACGDGSDEESARNRAIIYLLFETGMRISELCALTDATTEPAKRRARVLRAKGKKHRMVFWQPPGGAALARYVLLRRGKHGGPLFRGCSIRNNGGAVTPDSVRACLKRIASDAGIVLPKGAPLHSLRHGFAHAVIEHGGDLSELSQLLGHSSVETTMIYVRSDDRQLESAYQRIFGRKKPGASEAENHG